MSSFLITKKETKSFEDKISKLAKKTQSNQLKRRLKQLETVESDSENAILELLQNPKLAQFIKQKIRETAEQNK